MLPDDGMLPYFNVMADGGVQIVVGDLSSGIYLLRDEQGGTLKFVKE